VVFGARKNKKIKIKDDLNLNWYGHRGLLNRAPENTWRGFQAALDAGLRAIEIDVLQTKDGKIVCTHNFDLERETDGNGYIDYKTLSELKIINAGAKWPNIEAKIPTLESVLIKLPTECQVNIEGVIISSFNPMALRIIKCIDNTFETGLLFEDIRTVGLISFVCPNYIHPRSDIVTGDLIEYAKRYKLGINVWTVNSRAGMKFFIEKKVEGIITDYPEAIPNVI
jgi:glycerophosphoryl diester phosphodiesterase